MPNPSPTAYGTTHQSGLNARKAQTTPMTHKKIVRVRLLNLVVTGDPPRDV